MFDIEEEAGIIQSHIDCLNRILSDDWEVEEELDEDKIQEILHQCEDDINEVELSIPYDEMDDDEVPIEDFSEDCLSDGEIEDDVYRVESLIEELRDLMLQVENRYSDGVETQKDSCDLSLCDIQDLSSEPGIAEERFRELLLEWMSAELEKELLKDWLVLDKDTIYRIAITVFIAVSCRLNIEKCMKMAHDEYPEYAITETDIKELNMISERVHAISFLMVKDYEMYKTFFDFDFCLNADIKRWEDVNNPPSKSSHR